MDHSQAENYFLRFRDHLLELMETDPPDLIVGPGNSGSIMLELTRIVLDHYGHELPLLPLPIKRFVGGPGAEITDWASYDNTSLLSEVKTVVQASSPSHLLMVDDEIEAGRSLLAVKGLFEQAGCTPKLSVIAEDRGFKGSDVRLLPLGKSRGPYGVIYGLLSVIEPELKKLEGEWKPKELMAGILGLPLRPKSGAEPIFSFERSELMRDQLDNYDELQEAFNDYLLSLLS